MLKVSRSILRQSGNVSSSIHPLFSMIFRQWGDVERLGLTSPLPRTRRSPWRPACSTRSAVSCTAASWTSLKALSLPLLRPSRGLSSPAAAWRL